jgi:hypothetical protein
MTSVDELGALVRSHAPSIKVKGGIRDAITAAATVRPSDQPVDGALASCHPKMGTGQGIALVFEDALVVVHVQVRGETRIWEIPWSTGAGITADGGDITFAPPIDGLEGVSIFAPKAIESIRRAGGNTIQGAGTLSRLRDLSYLGRASSRF